MACSGTPGPGTLYLEDESFTLQAKKIAIATAVFEHLQGR
jgi:hypothetical protein